VSKNVAVFVDVANIFYAAKAAGVDIDYVTLLKSATAGRDFVRAYAYTGLDPDNENQRNFHQFLARHQYKVVSKDIRKYGDGKVKANLDIELVVDLMKTARNLDIAVIVSGDGDFASAIRAVQEMGVRVEVVSFRGNTSSDLIEVADLFTDITQIAKVDKGSTRSGRRVAEDDDEDLSMTEVPDKMTEGTGRGRGRGRGRGGRYERDEAPVAARAARGRVPDAPMGTPVAAAAGGALVALPGEKLSRAGAGAAAASADAGDEPELDDEVAIGADGDALDGDGRRRRRRRGGRGRGRGRRDEVGTVDGVEPELDADEAEDALVEAEADADADAVAATGDTEPTIDEDEEAVAEAPAPARGRTPRGGRTSSGEFATPFDDLEALAAPRAPRSTPFGSVWDTQLGAPARPAASGPAPVTDDDEDLEEPEIPEYLLAERRQANRGGANRGRGGGGGRNAAYAAAIERERYGGGRGSSGGSGINRYGETRGAPSQGRSGGGGSGGGGGNRSGQGGRGGSRNERPAERYDRAPRQASPSGSAEPWSEVPPELEELLRAQMAKSRPATPAASERVTEAPAPTPAPSRRTSTRSRSSASADTAAEAAPEVAEAPSDAAPKRRTTRKAPVAQAAESTDVQAGDATEAPAPKRRTTRSKAPAAAASEATEAVTGDATEAPAPKRRTTRAKGPAEATTEGEAGTATAAAPKRRTTRKAAPAADVTPTEG
jgi:uncharacterized LabA/DUF88 family protein